MFSSIIKLAQFISALRTFIAPYHFQNVINLPQRIKSI